MRALLILLPMLMTTAGANALPLPTAPMAIEPHSENASGQTHDLKLARDAYDRMTVSVRIGDSGPYRFLIDTGAERTVISRQLAQQLGLVAGARARLPERVTSRRSTSRRSR
jgi:predicted aspartyl protease